MFHSRKPFRKYVFKSPGFACITLLFVNKSLKFKIVSSVALFSAHSNCKRIWRSHWFSRGDKLDNLSHSISCFTNAVTQILAAIFDYNHCLEQLENKNTILRRFPTSSYEEYYTSISHGMKFRKKFRANESREFWLDLNPELDFKIHNVSCKLPMSKTSVLHSFRFNEISADPNLCPMYEMRSIILRKEYPISNLYDWIIREIIEYSRPLLMKVMYDITPFVPDVNYMIFEYMYS